MLISIVMGYHNRRKLLLNTLEGLSHYNRGKDDFEIIIVDDGSSEDQRIDDLRELYPALNIITFYLDPKKKRHFNPCITHNIAFNFARGEIILHQNTECLHVGDILGIIRSEAKKGVHLTFGVYSVNMRLQERLNNLTIFNEGFIMPVLNPMVGYKENWKDGDICWYNHSNYRRAFGSFCWAMMRSDLERLNGFDERYAFGFAYDDAEFTVRLERSGMKIQYIDKPFVVHQYHTPSDYIRNAAGVAINRNIYHQFTMKEKGFRAEHNTFYNKKP